MSRISRREALAAMSSALAWNSCREQSPKPQSKMHNSAAHDVHSYSEPEKFRVRHLDLDLKVSFAGRKLLGRVDLLVARGANADGGRLILDTRDLTIHSVGAGRDTNSLAPVKWTVGQRDAILGSPLEIDLPDRADRVRISYETTPAASGLQWLEPSQTAGKAQPFLFSQNESIHARSWIPLQDSPGVRVTYTANIQAPPALLALMSAEQKGSQNGTFRFVMDKPIPPYLIALAIGALEFSSTGPRTGVYAEGPVLRRAAHEFEDMEKLVEAVEKLYGPYRWGRYDLLILPPSFPFGGMENPRLTFATPTVIAGDKSLVGLVSHELAHSWSGNLVTNATWSDFWLNEGFTSYIENRIQEAVYGREQALMEQVLARRELDQELAKFDKRDQILHIDLKGRDPDDGTTQVPYIKGALLLRQMEDVFGRAVFDGFLKRYFDKFAFQSITTATMLDYLQQTLFAEYPPQGAKIPIQQWVYEPGLPVTAPRAKSTAFEEISENAKAWAADKVTLRVFRTKRWSTQQWLEFLQVLPSPLSEKRMAQLDRAYRLTRSGNDEILDQWLKLAIQSNYKPAFPRLKQFLMQVGRMKMIKPLYSELMKTPEGERFARQVYAEARSGYHPIAQTAIDKIVKPA
jgi:leukotriene A-4 hydrolase/aminopeptidase